jgi:hypothetical protein
MRDLLMMVGHGRGEPTEGEAVPRIRGAQIGRIDVRPILELG